MRGRSILCSLAILAGCSGGESAREKDSILPPGDALKVTYIRFNFDPAKKRYYPVYRVMVSESWRAKYGSTSREPFNRLFPTRGNRAPFFGVIQDRKMKEHLAQLRKRGLGDLVGVSPNEIDLVGLAQAEKSDATATKTRLITVGGDGGSKTYTFRHNGAGAEQIRKFFACESLVIMMGNAYTAQISVQAVPRGPR